MIQNRIIHGLDGIFIKVKIDDFAELELVYALSDHPIGFGQVISESIDLELVEVMLSELQLGLGNRVLHGGALLHSEGRS
jgi:hypothetical protein